MSQTDHPLVASLVEHTRANPQVYANSALQSDPLTAEYLASSDKLAGDKDPNLAILSERSEHRVIMFLRAQGKSPTEIAKATGYSYQWVCQVCRQPWFKSRLLATIKEAGEDGVQKFINGEILPSLIVLAEVRDDLETKDATRVAACNALLDRGLGKPVQLVKTQKVASADDLNAEMTDVERELAEIRRMQTGLISAKPVGPN